MAESPAHKFGQMIGELLETVVLPQLEIFCKNRKLYLDYRKKTRAIRTGKKVTWEDQYGNTHDLDFVIEQDGTDERIGRPLAFIETAWRRYTKHSRNKAQEIRFLDGHMVYKGSGEFRKYKILIDFSNANEAYSNPKQIVVAPVHRIPPHPPSIKGGSRVSGGGICFQPAAGLQIE